MPDNYDVAIIGSGPGGYVAAIRAAQLGLKTVVVEKDDKLGGACLHVGCIPTKALLHNAEVYEYVREAKEYGIQCGEPSLDWSVVQARKDGIVKKHAKGLEFLLKKNKVETVRGWGRLAGGGRLLWSRRGAAPAKSPPAPFCWPAARKPACCPDCSPIRPWSSPTARSWN